MVSWLNPQAVPIGTGRAWSEVLVFCSMARMWDWDHLVHFQG